MKYVMFEVKQGSITRKVPVVFPNQLVHSYVAATFKVALLRHWEHAEVAVVSAGTVDGMLGADITTSGNSESLGVQSSPDDAQVIMSYDYAHGV